MAPDSSTLSSICVGIVCIVTVRKVLPWLYTNIIGPIFLGSRIDFRRFGAWAVVTGATDGIGKAYAKALAKKGLNVVLISRSLSKLAAVAKEITDAHNVQIKIIDIDFTDGPQIYQKIEKNITGLDIGVLVNNVGISYLYPEFFIEYITRYPQFLRDIISVNIHSVTNMCGLVLPNMIAKKKGVIINLSSTAAVIPYSLLSVYSGTKAFVDKFSVDLQTEYRNQGIIVQSVQPGFVATNMAKIRKSTLLAPSPDTYVASALKTVGIARQTAGYLPHALLQLRIHLLGAVAGDQMARNFIFNFFSGMRKRALRNSEKKK
ncbi:very-long-chain 3-oxoacyl-CoA reductase-like [Teleopsis dalmanni]|uniref:very-long-chain 3-oxoacyl-CoA reductase-like n=1 Tax=Teleopsis dalmanni TaxID=139649 RepID=UPI0018CD436E|nr:very-long-chain 3-oxoacyl-CoA reductase-like [Teleopsis dalmanni]